VAGLFYPDNPVELKKLVDQYLNEAATDIPPPKAIIAPHAGFIYSGPVAARAYASLGPASRTIKKVILLGPAHRVYLHGLALPSADEFLTPLGNIPIDQELVKKLRDLPQIIVMDTAHAQEHSLEVHLPFLQTILDEFTLVPLVVGDASPDEVSEVLDLVWGGDETLIIISSDLSHYHDYATAKRIDAGTSTAIQHLELEKIGPHQACGCVPMSGLLTIARRSGMQVRMLDLRNSGDTAGTRDRVVGYGAYSVHMNQHYKPEHRKQLLKLAGASIANGLREGKPLYPDEKVHDPALLEQRASFVTLKINGTLRGCIGTTEPVSPLVIGVADNAFRAAFKDPRFKPLTPEEFHQVKISISVLSVPEPLAYKTEQDLLEKLRPGVDGLIIAKGGLRATFLPEVWESITTAEAFLSHLKNKAGIPEADVPEHAWIYTAEHIE